MALADKISITLWVKGELKRLGFDEVKIAALENFPSGDDKRLFSWWICKGLNADMKYLEKTMHVRFNPQKFLKGAKYAVVCALVYGNGKVGNLKFARYSTRRDYHNIFRKRLKKFVKICRGKFGGNYRIFSDAHPVLERSLGKRAGMGWIGKNSMLISPKFGSFFVIGGFFTDLDLIEDEPFEEDFCGKCNRCVEACPTNAILKNRTVDSNKCISYWTIEYKGGYIPVNTYGWFFGCDICQEVCPWNRKNNIPPNPIFPDMEIFERLGINDILSMDGDKFRKAFQGTPIMRAGLKGLKRNILKASNSQF